MGRLAGKNSVVVRSLLMITALLGCGSAVAAYLYVVREELPRRDVASLPPVVEFVRLKSEDATEWFVGYGSASPDRSATLSAEVAGMVVELVGDIEAGSVIEQGEVLIRLDAREYRHQLDRTLALAAADQAAIEGLDAEVVTLKELMRTAEHEVRVAAGERDRVSGLFERNLAAKKEFDFATLAYQQARRVLQGYKLDFAKTGPRRRQLEALKRGHEAEAALAELNVERCQVSAPFGGRIDALYVEVGDRVGPGSSLVRIIDPGHVEVAVQLPGSVYDRVAVGAPCELHNEGRADISWRGQVARIAPSVDDRTRTFSAYLEVDNEEQSRPLVPGVFVTVRVRGAEYKDRILVPRSAIRNGGVFVAEGNVARRRSVTVERLIGDRAVVRGDVNPGELFIVSHAAGLRDGSPIRLRTALSSSSPTDASPHPAGEGASP